MKMNKSDRKKHGNELQEYLQFRRRGFQVNPKKDEVLILVKLSISKYGPIF